MADRIEVNVKTEQVRQKFRQMWDDINGRPMIHGMRDASLVVLRGAKENAPVDTGRLKSSLTAEVTSLYGASTVLGVVGSNLDYGLYQEKGTKPFWPPLDKLELWARRHGTTAWVVAAAIARRGIVARRYLRRALRDNSGQVAYIIGHTVNRIVRK